MKTLRQFINETVIKLRGFNHRDKQHRFFDDLEMISQKHPMNNTHRLIGNAAVHLSSSSDGVHLHDIYTLKPKSGAGTEALTHLKTIADKHGVKISGHAQAYETRNKEKITSTARLKKWYGKNGFKATSGDNKSGYHVEYTPKKT